jgi:hypothetical protein
MLFHAKCGDPNFRFKKSSMLGRHSIANTETFWKKQLKSMELVYSPLSGRLWDRVYNDSIDNSADIHISIVTWWGTSPVWRLYLKSTILEYTLKGVHYVCV